VEKGYVDDVKKRLKDVKESESVATKVAGASARRFAISGSDAAGQRKLLVFAIVKGDHLYIVTGEAPADHFDPASDATQRVADSWKWTK
jgi:hypothetical protein